MVGRRLVVMDPQEADDDLVRDMAEVLTSFWARFFGRRPAAQRAQAALKAAETTAVPVPGAEEFPG